MKNLASLKGAKVLSKKEQQSVSGGLGPGACFPTGGEIVHCDTTCHCPGIWHNGCCWVCH